MRLENCVVAFFVSLMLASCGGDSVPVSSDAGDSANPESNGSGEGTSNAENPPKLSDDGTGSIPLANSVSVYDLPGHRVIAETTLASGISYAHLDVACDGSAIYRVVEAGKSPQDSVVLLGQVPPAEVSTTYQSGYTLTFSWSQGGSPVSGTLEAQYFSDVATGDADLRINPVGSRFNGLLRVTRIEQTAECN